MNTSPPRSPGAETGSMAGLALLQTGVAVTQTTCDREPIHTPGAVQPHGLLLVLDPETGAVRQTSANAGTFLGVSADERDRAAGHGLAVGRILRRDRARLARDRRGPAADAGAGGTGGRPVRRRRARESGRADRGVRAGARRGAAARWYGADRSVRAALAALDGAASVEALCAAFAREARRLLGIDRVMVYRFDADWHGEVVAEDHSDQVPESFLGLHFPATDIPEPARRLYLRNRVRIIPDVGYRASPLVPARNPATGAALDLSDSVLRSVSPVHVEYLQNMGVAASMSVSIVQGGRLWGLLACHHYAPYPVPYRLRAAADLLGQVFAMQLSLKRRETELQLESQAKTVLVRLVEQMMRSEHMIDGLTGETLAVHDLLDAAGSAVRIGGELRLLGETPSAEAVEHLLVWIREPGRHRRRVEHRQPGRRSIPAEPPCPALRRVCSRCPFPRRGRARSSGFAPSRPAPWTGAERRKKPSA